MRARCFEMREDHRAHRLILLVDMHVEFFFSLNSRMSLQSSVKASSLIRFRKRKFYISGPGHVVGHSMLLRTVIGMVHICWLKKI